MSRRNTALLTLVIAALGAVVFAPAIGGSWIYDDHLLVPGNPYVHSFEWWPRWFVTDLFDVAGEAVRLGSRLTYWRPAITATYALDWQLSGGTPALFHITNLLWHGAVGALTFLVLRRWLGAVWPAALAAVLFLVHPTKAESVAWISGRTDVICAVAMLLVAQGIARRLRGAPGGVLLEFGGTLLAYASKEQAIVLPIFAAMEGWVALRRPALDRPTILRMLRVAAPQTVIAIAYLVTRKLVFPIHTNPGDSAGLPMLDHLFIVLESFGRFVTLSFAPHDLSVQHGLTRIADGHLVHSTPYVVLGAVSIAALLAAAFVTRRRLPAVALGILFFLATLAPTSNIITTLMLTLISERFLYLPYLGIALAVGALLVQWSRRWAFGLVAAVTLVFAIQAMGRSYDFADEDRFWERELALHPESAEARRARIRVLTRNRQYRAALVDALELTRTASRNEDLPAATEVAQLLARLTPDRDRATLDAIDTFCHELLIRKKPEAVLTAGNLSFRVPTGGSRYEMYMGMYELSLLAIRMDLRSRLGDDAGAIALAEDALGKCSHCGSVLSAAALALARAGRYDDAVALLDSDAGRVVAKSLASNRELIVNGRAEQARAETLTGPAQLQARAAALAAVELWGRAYDVLAPHKDEIKNAPKFVKGFAELAVRAGEPGVAREVLAPSTRPAEIDALIAQWTQRMGWQPL